MLYDARFNAACSQAGKGGEGTNGGGDRRMKMEVGDTDTARAVSSVANAPRSSSIDRV